MFAAIIKLRHRPDREEARAPNSHIILVPGGQPGVWISGGLGFLVILIGILVSLIPPGESASKLGFELKLLIGTLASILLGLILYWRGARTRATQS
jgi:hypothetical protein